MSLEISTLVFNTQHKIFTMRKIISTLFFTVLTLTVLAQVKKPTLMVVPADSWCSQNGFTTKYNDQGRTVSVADYGQAVLQSSDCFHVITKINALMSDRDFPLKDLASVIKSIEANRAMDAATKTKSGSILAESPLDILKRTANADIMIELNWTVNERGPKRSVTYSLAAKDAYTDKQIAGCQGTGEPSFSTEVPLLIEEAVVGSIDQFASQLQAHFEDMMESGREVLLEVKVVANRSGIDMTSEYGGEELMDIIENWVEANTVNHRFNLSQGSENFLKFEQVRIPLYQANGLPTDTRRWARELVKFLKSKHNIPCRVDIRGLGKAVVMVGEK